MLIFRNCYALARSLVMFHNHFHIQVYYFLLISINISKHKQHQHQQHHQATPHSAAVSALSLCFIQHGAQHFALPQWLYRTFEADYRDLTWEEPHLYLGKEHWKYDIEVLHKEHPFMRHLVIHASSGDSRTPLMPCCVDFKSARHWNSRADA